MNPHRSREPDYVRTEHIGEEVIVENKKSQELSRGRIIDETRDTYLIQTKNGLKHFIKKDNNFIFINFKVKIDGSRLNKRPEDRIKIKRK